MDLTLAFACPCTSAASAVLCPPTLASRTLFIDQLISIASGHSPERWSRGKRNMSRKLTSGLWACAEERAALPHARHLRIPELFGAGDRSVTTAVAAELGPALCATT